ncbi:MAG: hypothetical protein FJY82_12445 [Candidatus Aminicenantes bacterium]|nr:hypothetical protein [Candidatus Aminicenantes bacterium]
MTPQKDVLDESAVIIQEIETTLEKALQKRREEIERELEEKIRRDREEYESRLRGIEEDFARERDTIKEYRSAVAEFETVQGTLQAEIREHLDKSIGFQKEIERLTARTLDELRTVADKSSQLSEVRDRAEEKVAALRTKLKEKFGIVADEPLGKSDNEIVVNLEQELSKLKRIKELLENDSAAEEDRALGSEPESPAGVSASQDLPAPDEDEPLLRIPEEAEPELPPTPEPLLAEEEPRAEIPMPEINKFIEEFVKREQEAPPVPHLPEPEPPPAVSDGRKAAADDLNFQAVFETLEKYRKSETTDYDGEISYFQNLGRSVLDGESLIRAVGHMLEEARKLYEKIVRTESPKDQFFIKQELINHQEILRKIILRAVKLCEREGHTLPRFTEEILNLAVLKDLLEKLNLDNWSNADDFRSFEASAGRLKDAFYKRITPPAHYLRSIVQELEA